MKQKWFCCPALQSQDRFMVLTIGKDVFLLFRNGGSVRKTRAWLANMQKKFVHLSE